MGTNVATEQDTLAVKYLWIYLVIFPQKVTDSAPIEAIDCEVNL
jgi:hypothetical protein